MRVLGLIVVVGLVARGACARRRPPGGQAVGLRALLLGAVMVQVIGGALVPVAWRAGPVAICYLLVLGWVAVNIRQVGPGPRIGLAVVGAGAVLNLLPIMASGGMPVSAAGLRRIGVRTADPAGHLFRHVAGQSGHIMWLADVIALPTFRAVVSVGDLVLGAGLLILLVVTPLPSETGAAPQLPLTASRS